MFDITLVAELIQHQIGELRYQENVMYIAELLSQISPETIPELQSEGSEEYIAKRIIRCINGDGRIDIKTGDVLTQHDTNIINPADMGNMKTRQTENGVTEITNFGSSKASKRYAIRDRLEKLKEIRDILLENKGTHLTAIKSGVKNETANDWLSDAIGRNSRDQESVFMREQIKEIRKLSRANIKAKQVQQHIRNLGISDEDLESLPPAAIYAKYDIEERLGIANDGKFRMRLTRLRKERF